MRGYLLDTNVISEYSRTKLPDARVRSWVDAQVEASLYLSALTLGESEKVSAFYRQATSETRWNNGSKGNCPPVSRVVF